jgi:HSP20 family molecular chaperone IbpA|tara:strand:+ start:631 stop:1050 length:420 start_codon:yes stop_codon:yes gene_type:complete
MTKLTINRGYTNPITEIEQALDGFFNITPIFHNLEEIYKTGDQVRFASREDSLNIQIDIPGCKKEDLDIKVDSDERVVYIEGKRTVKTNDSEEVQTMNRSFSIGREYDLKKIKFTYEYGVLEVNVPRRKKEEYIRKITL